MAKRVIKKRTFKDLGRRSLSAFMALVMLISMIQISAFAADPNQAAMDLQERKQIVDAGGSAFYDKDGEEVSSLGSSGVKVTKTVSPTGTENLFQIDLEVVTTQDLQEVSLSPDAAVVLVMDTSNSMVNNYETVNNTPKSRMELARAAAHTFLSNYVQDSGNAKRMVSIVEFGTDAHTVLNWTDANSKTTQDGNTVVTSSVTDAVNAVENSFTYYECLTTGQHSHTTSFVSQVRNNNWDEVGFGGNRHYECSICGVTYGYSTDDHSHCTYSECETPTNTTHTHTVSYTGPHGTHTDGYTASQSSSSSQAGGTNIEGGLMMARNLILAGQQTGGAIAGMENLYVILLTDGVPTFYVSDDNTSTTETNVIIGSRGGGTYSTTNDHEDVPGLSADIQRDTVGSAGNSTSPSANAIQFGAKLYSLVYGNVTNTITIGSGRDTTNYSISSWLTDIVGVDHNYSSSTGGDVATNLANIGSLIGTLTQAWIVNDPIPAGGIVTFANSNLNSNGGAFSSGNSTYVKYWNAAENKVVWDLKQETPTKNGNQFTYSLSYQVILNTEHTDFISEQAYPTNGQAQLKYLVLDASENLDSMTAAQVEARMKLADFAIPTVKGYEGQFDFTKIAHHRNEDGSVIPLGAAPFQLTNLANTAVEQIANTITFNTTSQIDADEQTEGLVDFSGIPSGFSYTMTEGPAAEFTYNGKTYETSDDQWSVSVAYGEVTLSPDMEDNQVENTLKQIPTTLEITKVWQIPSGSDTQAITVYLKQDGSDFATLTLNGASATSSNADISIVSKSATATQWVYTVTVPSINQETGGLYKYTVTEKSLGDGYNTTYGQDGLSITNTTTGKTSVSVVKNWLPIDGKDVSATMPAVTVTLKRISENVTTPATAGTVILSSENGWAHTFNELDQYDSYGKPYTYSVSESQGTYQQVGEVTGTGTAADPFVLTNTVLAGTVSKTVTKTWNDGGIIADRPASITVTLLQDRTEYRTYELSADNDWTYTFTDLPQYGFTTNDSGVITSVHEHTYTVAELTKVEGYTPIKDGELGLRNTRTETVSINVEKIWKDSFDNHDEVTIILLRNGTEEGRKVTESGAVSFTDLNRFDSDGVEYSYTIQEADVPTGYTPSYDYGTGNTDVVFVDRVGSASVTNTLNTRNDTTSVTVNKVWQHPAGTTAPNVTFTLTQIDEDGNETTYDDFEMTAGTTTYTFENLPLYYYEQEEVQVATGETDPETNEPIMTTEIQVNEGVYEYTVSESSVNGYNSDDGVQDGNDGNTWTFTNTITGTVSDLSVEKVWVDLGSSRPTASFTLMRTDGTVEGDELVYEQVATWSTTANETHNWGTLAKYNELGQLYTYKVVEGTVANYSTSYSVANGVYSDSAKHITVTNTLNQDSTGSYTATKTWQDDSNALNTRQAITLELLRSGTSLGTVVINADGTKASTGTYTGASNVTVNGNVWTVSFTGLEKYNIGSSSASAYTYSIREVGQVEGYISRQNGDSIVNTLAQDTTSVGLTKHWVDPADAQHPNATFVLSAATVSGAPVTSVTMGESTITFPQTLTLGFNGTAAAPVDQAGAAITDPTADTWYYTWENLPKYTDSQQLITYTVTEQDVAGYTKAATGNVFTNTIEQDTVNVSGTKTWDMSAKNEDDVIKPDVKPVTVALYLVNGTSLSLVEQEGLINPVQINADAELTADFSFENLPKYNLATGDELIYTVREVEVTTAQDGTEGYTPIEADGTIQFEGEGQYTVTYNGSDITNTYSDPERYFYKITADYVAYFTSNNDVISTASNVNLTKDEGGNTVAYLEGTADEVIEAITSQYTQYNGVEYIFDADDESNVISVTLDQENKLYEIHLNYIVNLYKLDVEYIFADNSTHAGYDAYTDPVLGDADDDGNYIIPDNYRGDDTYAGTYMAAPTGYEVTQVTLKDSDADARIVDNTFNGGTFDDHDVKVVYVYNRVVAELPNVTDPTFTIRKVNSETQNLITHAAAQFQVFSDAACTTPVEGMVFSTVNGLVTVHASDLGEGTWYLKETSAPTGYTKADTVWQILVTYSEDQRLTGDKFVNYQTWTLDVTVLGQEGSALSAGDLVVPNQRQYGYLTINKTVTGLLKNESNTFSFTVTGDNYGTAYSNTVTISVTGNNTKGLTAALRVPTGTYVVTEDSTSAQIGSYEVSTSYSAASAEVTTANSEQAPASVTVTNAYTYLNGNDQTISGTKFWDDDNNRDGLRPLSIRVQLFLNDVTMAGKTADVSTSSDGSFSITYDEYLNPGTITVKEVGYTDAEGYHEGIPAGYTPIYGTEANQYDVTNIHAPETVTISAEKIWENGRQQAVTFHLLADGIPAADLVLDGELDETETEAWKGTFSGTFYKYSNGQLVDYTVEEDSLGNRWSYTVSESQLDTGYHFAVVNSYDAPPVKYFTVTVNYYDKETGDKIAQSYVSEPIRSGNSYDVTAQDAIDIEGYTYDSTTGDPITGVMNSDKVVDVWYIKVTEIEDEDPPITDLPDDEPPMADVPKTGDQLNFWMATAAASALGLVALTATGKKRKEEESI